MAKDAAEIPPRFIPDEKLRPRDDSGGDGSLGFPNYSGKFDDGGYVYGDAKPHLGPGKGRGKGTDD